MSSSVKVGNVYQNVGAAMVYRNALIIQMRQIVVSIYAYIPSLVKQKTLCPKFLHVTM